MPKGKPFKDVNELLEAAKKRMAELAESGAEQTNWDEMEFMTDVRIADFVEQRFIGMNENFVQMEHDINAADRRLENMKDSPRKTAAKTILGLYRQLYLEASELAYMSRVYSEAQMMTITEPYKSRVSREIISQRNRLDGVNMRAYLAKTEELSIYQNMMGTFFMDNAIRRQTEEGQIDAAREKAQNDVLKTVAEKLPNGPEYDLYRTMDGYVDQKAEELYPQEAEMIMNSNVVTNVTVNNFPDKIRAEKPKRVDIEWGVSTFDNMMDALYNKDELKAIRKDDKNFLETVFLDGKPALSVLPKQKANENTADYMRRMKCEVVAYALEGKARMDIAPYKKTVEGYEFKNPIPMRVKVNLKEEVSLWRRFKNFLGVSKTISRKEMVERISLDDIGKEDHHMEIQQYIEGIVNREKEHRQMKTAMKDTQDSIDQADLDFFGFTIEGKTPGPEETYHTLIGRALSEASKVKMDEDMAKELGAGHKDYANGELLMMKTLDRLRTRTSLCRLYAMTQGMTMEEVLSSDPALRERKEAIGREFLDKVNVMSKEEFAQQNGMDADYNAYIRDHQVELCDMLGIMMQFLGEQPLDFYRSSSPAQLAVDHQKADFIITVTQDLFQCCPNHVKLQNYDEMEDLEQMVRCVGELQHIKTFGEDYVASDSYVTPAAGDHRGVRQIVEGTVERIAMNDLVSKTRDVTRLKEIRQVATEKWAMSILNVKGELHSRTFDDPEYVAMCNRFAQTGKGPVIFTGAKENEFIIGEKAALAGLQKAQSRGNMKEMMDFEELSKAEIKQIARKRMTPKELEKDLKAEKKTSLFKRK